MAVLWHCFWGSGLRGNSEACWALHQLSVTSPIPHKQIGLFWCWFPGGWFCVHSRTLWVSPTNSPMRLGVSPTASTPTGVCSHRVWGFIFLYWNPGLCSLSHSPIVPPSLSGHKCGTACSASQCLIQSARHCLAQSVRLYIVCPSHPGTSLLWVFSTTAAHLCPSYHLDECFFFNSLVVRHPYSSIFWKFLLFLVFKLVVVLLLVVQGGTVNLPPSWPEVLTFNFKRV